MENQDAQTGNHSPFCVECRDQEASIFCEQCDEDFCEVCHAMLHRTGNRRKHTAKNLKVETSVIAESKSAEIDLAIMAPELKDDQSERPQVAATLEDMDGTVISSGNGATFADWMTKRAKYVPLRLDEQERGMLRLLEAGLNVSEYTDKIDVISYSSNKAKRIVGQIRDLCAIIAGLLVSGEYKIGAQLFSENSLVDNEVFFQLVFEVGRRHKIMNPEKMRSTYGKLMYLLMDSVIPEVEEQLGFSCVIPIKTVYDFLKERECLELLHDDSIALATREISPEFKTREQIKAEMERKKRAIDLLCENYATDKLSVEDIDRCLKSLSDNHAYLKANRDPCEKMQKYLTKHFNPKGAEANYSLAITAGRHGHRLSHNHSDQYSYVHQSLSLWREIVHEMFMLWSLADEDLISPNPYRLTNTGQGLQRIQPCSHISGPIHKILHRTQKKYGSWIGSSAIHLGDRSVPNAFIFIDKYNQVSRILTPLVNTLDKLESLTADPQLAEYIEEQYGGVERCRKDILHDFFCFGFNGSGADNYFDAGSCIDGRLTSAWNWCSQIEKKPFFPIFLLTGFVGFDGGSW